MTMCERCYGGEIMGAWIEPNNLAAKPQAVERSFAPFWEQLAGNSRFRRTKGRQKVYPGELSYGEMSRTLSEAKAKSSNR